MHVGKRVGVSLFTIILYLLLEALYEWLGLSTVPANILAVGIALLSTLLLLFGSSAIKWLRSRLRLRPKRHRTYGREFLLLLDKDVRQECFRAWDSSSRFSRRLNYFATLLLVFSSYVNILEYQKGFLDLAVFSSVVFLGCWLFSFYKIHGYLSKILLPIYRQRRRDKAQATRIATIQTIEAKLPPARYRLSGLTITSIEQLRTANDQLPEELVADAKDLERADQELLEAEADLVAPPATQSTT